MPPPLMIDPRRLDFEHPTVNLEGIRAINPQRYEMEQLSGIVLFDASQKIIVGYKDVGRDEFWVRGHMPGFPLLPGVLICEAAAQLCSYYVKTQGLDGGADFVGFGGMDDVKFRGTVQPGDRLIIAARAEEIRPGRRAVFQTQGIVEDRLVFHGEVVGVPISQGRGKARGPTQQEADAP